MRIGIPIARTEEGMQLMLAPSFYSCSYVGIYDLQFDKLEIVPAAAQNSGLLELLRSQDIKAVVSPSFKVMALSLFNDNSIAVYHSEGLELQHNLDRLKNNTLSKYSIWGF